MSKSIIAFGFFLVLLFAVLAFDGIEKFISLLSIILNRNLDRQFWVVGLERFSTELLLLATLIVLHRQFRKFTLKWIAVALLLIHFFNLFQVAVNIPITDDYKCILGFGNVYFSEQDSAKAIPLITSFFVGHRLIFLHLIEIFQYYLLHEINLKEIIVFGNLFLIPLCFFISMGAESKFNEKTFLLATLLIVHLGFYDTLVWATSMNYIWVSAFAVMSFYFLSRNNKYSFSLSIALSLSAVMSFENGCAVLLVNFIFLILKKEWRKSFLILILSIIIIYFYKDASYPVLPQLFTFSFQNISFIFCFLGSCFQYFYRFEMPYTAGMIIVFLFFVATYKKYYRKNFTVYATWLFILISAVMASLFRTSGGLETAISNRYGFFSCISVACCVIFLSENFSWLEREKKFATVFLLAAAFHLSTFIFFYPEVVLRKQKLESFIKKILQNETIISSPPVIPDDAETIIRESISNGIYRPVQ